jgi:hypothetical protein
MKTKMNFTQQKTLKGIFVLLLATFLVFDANAYSDETILEKALYNLPDVTFKKISGPDDPYLKYELKIRQPLDHHDAASKFYYQQVILTHRGFDKPTVMNINGYEIYKAKNEIVEMLHANELNIEYRYFGESVPETIQWKYLNYDQVSNDLHRINRMFKTLYTGKWISTGISRGGQTTIIYRYFYPQDVDLAIPYVAPMNKSLEDKRIYAFLDTMGSSECRHRIYDFQVNLLKNEPEILEKLKWYAKGKNIQFNYLGSLGKAFEYAVLEYPFSFWQVGYTPCDKIPENQTEDAMLEHMLEIVDLDFYSDKTMTGFAVHYYQNMTEGGYYGYNAIPFKKYLHYIKEPEPSATFPPKSETYKPFDSSLMDKILAWLDKEGNNFIYIYGGRDTWSACRVSVSGDVNSRLYMVPGANHYEARVINMPPAMQKDFAGIMNKMLGAVVDLSVMKSFYSAN